MNSSFIQTEVYVCCKIAKNGYIVQGQSSKETVASADVHCDRTFIMLANKQALKPLPIIMRT